MRNKIFKFFDKLEDKIRFWLSHYPLLYALVAGVAIVLFWRSVWGLADEYGISNWLTLIVGSVAMLLTGTFVSFFIGDRIVISGLKEEKRIDQKTEEELKKEESAIEEINEKLDKVSKEVKEIKNEIKRKA